MADNLSVSGTTNPYGVQSYTPASNDKNTITMTGFFQLLATQLQNQDMSNPMDNSEIMAQMVQMAMVQSMTTMSDAVKNSTAVNTQTYAAGLVGQEVTMAVTEENEYGQETPVDVKYAKVEWVNFTTGEPTIKIADDDKEYKLAHLVGMGRVPNPFTSDSASDGDDKEPGGVEGDGDENQKPGGAEGDGSDSQKPGGVEGDSKNAMYASGARTGNKNRDEDGRDSGAEPEGMETALV
ncbi:flagellar hook capping protein [Clostridiaceae bacterium]|nr:flagellar hook capping protein [Clostridiaceae bacterium]RKI11218.1 flagellar hook capping protein [bacterium 1XD21-70]